MSTDVGNINKCKQKRRKEIHVRLSIYHGAPMKYRKVKLNNCKHVSVHLYCKNLTFYLLQRL